ncbi:hypothetical protein [Chitinophaga caseinilytica]|uniref:Uncharacterized protein n=1 Tax=Chitinophaga caseinilytica TaxID=2267521 RepID=A0ABZ2Z9U3_9BACT
MKQLHIFLMTFLLFPAAAFSQEASSDSLIVILQEKDPVPEGATRVGAIRIKDGGFKSRCGYDQTLEEAREKARTLKGNLIKITELKPPDNWSTCYRLRADVYHHDGLADIVAAQQAEAAAAIRTMLPDTASYALLCVYRPKTGVGTLVQYNLHVNDSVVCRVKRGGSYMIKLHTMGQTQIWARTESRAEVSADIQPGKVYFLKCGIGMGAFVGRPQFYLMNTTQGMSEFSSMYGSVEEEE